MQVFSSLEAFVFRIAKIANQLLTPKKPTTKTVDPTGVAATFKISTLCLGDYYFSDAITDELTLPPDQ